MRVSKFSFLLIALALVGTQSAQAIPITWRFEGHTAGPGLPGGTECPELGCQDIIFDTPFVGAITFDSDAEDLSPLPLQGSYVSSGGPYGLWIQIGQYRYETHSVRTSIAVFPSTTMPQYNFLSDEANGLFTRIALWNCYGSNPQEIASDAQRIDPISAQLESGCPDPRFIRTTGNIDIALEVTRYYRVPEPSTVALCGIGILGLLVATRRRLLPVLS